MYQLIQVAALFLLFSCYGCVQKGIGTTTILVRVFVTSDSDQVKGDVPISVQVGNQLPTSYVKVPVRGHADVEAQATIYTEDSLVSHNRFFPLRDISVRTKDQYCEGQSIRISQSNFVMKPKPILTLNCVIQCGKPTQDK